MSAEGLPEQRPVGDTADAEIVDLAASPPVDGLTSAVLEILDRAPQQRSWVKSAILLGVSLFIFAATGFFNDKPSRLALLIGILFFHELGHYAGMRLFNYQDVQMFFIPLFGAAVRGRTRSIEGYKEAIVLLLGPLPGILLGTVLGIIARFYDHELLSSAALLLLVINGFNLLPFMPLDGGRLLHLILFSRQPILEAVFRVFTGGLLALCGLALRGWMLGIAGLAIVVGTPHVFRLSRLARKLRGPLRTGEVMDLSAKIPFEWAVPLIETVRAQFPRQQNANAIANTVRQLWERIHLRPPGWAASIVLLMLYGLGFIAAPVMAIGLSLPVARTVARVNGQGQPMRAREVRMWGRLKQSTEIDAADQPHGRHVEYYAGTGQVEVEGSYKKGLPEGTWKWFSEDGQLQSVREFRNGEPVGPAGGQDPPLQNAQPD